MANPLEFLARPRGFEPPTHGFVVRCSIRLSYGRVFFIFDQVLDGPAVHPKEGNNVAPAPSPAIEPPRAAVPQKTFQDRLSLPD